MVFGKEDKTTKSDSNTILNSNTINTVSSNINNRKSNTTNENISNNNSNSTNEVDNVSNSKNTTSLSNEEKDNKSSKTQSVTASKISTEPIESNYVLNTNTKKFHKPSCSSVNKIKQSNRKDYTGTREEVINRGYVPCKNCNP